MTFVIPRDRYLRTLTLLALLVWCEASTFAQSPVTKCEIEVVGSRSPSFGQIPEWIEFSPDESGFLLGSSSSSLKTSSRYLDLGSGNKAKVDREEVDDQTAQTETLMEIEETDSTEESARADRVLTNVFTYSNDERAIMAVSPDGKFVVGRPRLLGVDDDTRSA